MTNVWKSKPGKEQACTRAVGCLYRGGRVLRKTVGGGPCDRAADTTEVSGVLFL